MQMKMCLDTVTTLPHSVGVARAITTWTGIPVFYRLGRSNVASNSRMASRTVLGSTSILFLWPIPIRRVDAYERYQ
jgi:hypothetical protein